MVEGYVSEDEQVESLKKWWKENGTSIIVGVVLGLSILFGWRGWVQHTQNRAAAASLKFEQMMNQATTGHPADAIRLGQNLMDEYGSTVYATLAALEVARVQVDQGKLAEARKPLQWALGHADQRELQLVARQRLAALMIDQGDADAALALLAEAQQADGFASAYDELRGDAWRAKGDLAQARSAYQSALEHTGPEAAGRRSLLQMKLADLGVQPS